MDTWHVANGFVSLIGACCLSWVILHPNIHEGIIVKIGLMTMVVSLLMTAKLTLEDSTDWTAYWRAALWLRIGICVVCTGVVLRITGTPLDYPRRRMTDWLRYHGEHPHEVSGHRRSRGH